MESSEKDLGDITLAEEEGSGLHIVNIDDVLDYLGKKTYFSTKPFWRGH